MASEADVRNDVYDPATHALRSAIASVAFTPAEASHGVAYVTSATNLSTGYNTVTPTFAAKSAGAGARSIKFTNSDTAAYLYVSFDVGTTDHIKVLPGESFDVPYAALGLEVASAIYARRFGSSPGTGAFSITPIY